MSEKEEQLSALMDGELSDLEERRIIGELAGDRRLAERWARYHLLRDVLRNNAPRALSADLAERVSVLLAEEPIAFAPLARARWRGVAKQVAGLGVAAAIATVAVLNLPSAEREQSGREVAAAGLGPAGTTDAEQAQDVGGAAVVSSPGSDIAGADPWQRRALVVDSKLSGYLVNHNEYAVTSGFQGTLPYMRIVGTPATPIQGTHENR